MAQREQTQLGSPEASHESLSGSVPWEGCPCQVKSRGATLALSTAWLAVPASEFGRDKDVQLPLQKVERVPQCFFLDRELDVSLIMCSQFGSELHVRVTVGTETSSLAHLD